MARARVRAQACAEHGRECARRYIRRLNNAWKPLPDLPPRDENEDDDNDPRAAANAIEAQRRRWTAKSPR